jgi:hypothetical protein
VQISCHHARRDLDRAGAVVTTQIQQLLAGNAFNAGDDAPNWPTRYAALGHLNERPSRTPDIANRPRCPLA